jgi:hypothetical protein
MGTRFHQPRETLLMNPDPQASQNLDQDDVEPEPHSLKAAIVRSAAWSFAFYFKVGLSLFRVVCTTT